jgi:two-component system, OmpR family, phosphate regulon sensor histidine kinase PhoR
LSRSNPLGPMNWMLWLCSVGLFACALLGLHLRWRRRLDAAAARWRENLDRVYQQKEQARAAAHERQGTLFNSMSQGVLVLDSSDRIQFGNYAFREIFGIAGEFRSRTLMEVVRLHEVSALVAAARAQGQVVRQELKLSAPVERWLEVTATPMPKEGDLPGGTVFVFHDVTRLKRLEMTRKDFVANVSHELRTPLSLIKGYVETLLDGAKEDPELRQKFLQTIARNAERLQLLIEDLLVISELESGRGQLRVETVVLGEVVLRIFDDFQKRAMNSGTMLENQTSGLRARADRYRLEQVMSNLVDNALKYGASQGKVLVGARKLGNGFIEVFVRNDGPGIPPGALSRLFERFYRVDKGRSREQGGTGLGLAIVKHIVQNHGGKVWATSEPGKGACFYFTVPEERTTAASPAKSEITPSSASLPAPAPLAAAVSGNGGSPSA